jgi:hypothetical protein
VIDVEREARTAAERLSTEREAPIRAGAPLDYVPTATDL